MTRLFVLVFLIIVAFLSSSPASAQRYASCDLCGLCQEGGNLKFLPQSWEKCRQCLYPGASADPDSKETLEIDPIHNLPPTPFPGRQYTTIGCISTNLNSFTKEGAAASVVQILLDLIFGIIGAVAFLYLLYGAFIILTSQNNPERLDWGKRIIVAAVVGLAFSLFSVFIVNFVALQILKIPGF